MRCIFSPFLNFQKLIKQSVQCERYIPGYFGHVTRRKVVTEKDMRFRKDLDKRGRRSPSRWYDIVKVPMYSVVRADSQLWDCDRLHAFLSDIWL